MTLIKNYDIIIIEKEKRKVVLSMEIRRINKSVNDLIQGAEYLGCGASKEAYVKNGVVDLAIINMPIENEQIFNITNITKTHDCFIANINFDKNYLSKQELTNQN